VNSTVNIDDSVNAFCHNGRLCLFYHWLAGSHLADNEAELPRGRQRRNRLGRGN